MAEETSESKLTQKELDRILARAKAEGWTELALVKSARHGRERRRTLVKQGWHQDRIFILAQPLTEVPSSLVALTKLTSLSLWGNQIGPDGASALAVLTNLTSLDLRVNQIGADGARALTALTNLTSLSLWGNRIGPDGASALAALTKLTSLSLWGNQIGDDGARALATLTHLTSLNLRNNNIGDEGARALAALTKLTSLDLRGNNIGAEGARALAVLINLTSLDLTDNQIVADGARALTTLTNLTTLNVGDNNIGDEGARALATLTNLTSLDLWGNQIGAEGIAELLDAWLDSRAADRLEQLNLGGNADLSGLLPAEALLSSDAQAILAAYRRYRSARQAKKLVPLNEAKLLVVGNEAVGKTSLVNYLIYNKPRDPNEAKTPGIALREKIDTRQWPLSGGGVRLNVWDFGGQEIMHGTHKFFLTARSLYLLVLEARREDDRSVYEWLKTIRNRGGDSPIIVVINKCEPPRDLRLDEAQLRREYPNIVDFVRSSCDSGKEAAASIDRLRALIAQTLKDDARLKHIRDGVPTAWQRVKSTVAELARQRRVLSVRDYERLCEGTDGAKHSADDLVTDNDEQRALLGLLHDLGVVVAHGLRRDAPAAMQNVTLLDPNWLTGAIYALLNNSRIKDQGGEFSWSDLGELLDPAEYPAEWHEYIVEMMEHKDVGLCFELAGTRRQRFLIPEALPASEPEYGGIWPDDCLRFRYDYEFLPAGLVPRFIVQAHRNLTANPTRWRAGVVLEAASCPVLVRADLDRKRVHIQVAGAPSMRRSALNIVIDDLDEVHRLNPETKPKAMVPLTDEPDLAVSYDHLRKLEDLYGSDYSFHPDGAGRAYVVRELLEGVRRERRRTGGDEWAHERGVRDGAEDERGEMPPMAAATPETRAEVGAAAQREFTRVFLSSTATDLSEHREQVYQAIQRLDGCHCVRMEDFGARDREADAFCLAKVAECDVFVGLIGHVHGSCPAGCKKSYTELEYAAAVKKRKPRLMFVAPEEFAQPASVREPDEQWQRQQAFRKRVNAERVRDTITSPDDLARGVVQAIRNWEREQASRPRGRVSKKVSRRTRGAVPPARKHRTSGGTTRSRKRRRGS